MHRIFVNRRTLDRLRLAYCILVLAQGATLVLYRNAWVSREVAFGIGLTTSVLGPAFSLAVSLHTFSHRRMSRALDIISVAITYFVTCLSFAILFYITDDRNLHAFTLPASDTPPMALGAAIYFSLTTITTTGFGDIVPASALARLVTCLEIITGLAYQVFIFSLAASLLSPAPTSAEPDGRRARSAPPQAIDP